jgi:hypothetical protein
MTTTPHNFDLELQTKLESIESRRQAKDWQPQRAASSNKGTPHPAIIRAVGLRKLEIPVGKWTEQFIYQNTPPSSIINILEGHILDEDKHDLQLSYLADYLGSTDIPEEAQELTDRWLNLACDSLLKKMALEAGVFFPILGMMGVYAQGDLFIQATRQWISSDESAHVASARTLIAYLNKSGADIKPPAGLRKLVEDTVTYIVGANSKDLKKWLSASESGLTSGKIIGGDEMTGVASMETFTQRRNNEIPYQNQSK